ncbi:MAG: MBL fold metallo-hydrolase [Thermoanaerobaculia bacterium]
MTGTSTGPAALRWVALGTNGFFPSWGRETMSFLLHRGGRALLFDAGTGLGRLVEPELRRWVEDQDRLDLVLTHYHLDHVVGLAYLSGLWNRPVRIFGPEAPLVDADPVTALRRLVSPPLFPKPLDELGLDVEIVPYSGTELTIGSFDLVLRRQRHPGGSVGVRVDDALAYVTDTEPDPGTVDLCRGARTLLHEVWSTGEEAAAPDYEARGHSSTTAVAEIASEAGVGRLVPVHHRPDRDATAVAAVAAELASLTACPVVLADEGRAYEA